MNMEIGYNRWDIVNSDSDMDIQITELEFDRGGQLGKTTWYGSKIDFKSSWLNLSTNLPVTFPDSQDCKGSLIQILTQHSRQIQLGTFGKVIAPHHSSKDQFRDLLRRLGENIIQDDVKDFVQIPFVAPFGGDSVLTWTGKQASVGAEYKAYRKYNGSFYVTKIQREISDFSIPVVEELLPSGIMKRKETIEVKALLAEPLSLLDAHNLFSQ